MNRPRIVVVGAGRAGHQAAALTPSRQVHVRAQAVLLDPVHHFPRPPLLPGVAAGTLEPRRACVALTGARRTRYCADAASACGRGRP